MNNVKKRIASGAAWMVLARLADRSLGFVSAIILARLLIPADFGLVAMAMSVVAMIELLTAFSFDAALVSTSAVPQERYHTAWTLNISLNVAAGVLIMLLAYPASVFYREPRLFALVALLGATLAIQGFENIGVVAFRKEMQFRRDFAFLFSKRLLGFLVTVPLALATRSYWALAAGIVATRIGGVVLSYAMHPFRPRISFQDWRALFAFSRWLLINNFLTFVNSRSTDLIIGRATGPTSLGLYNIGYELATLPSSELSAPINRAVLPGYALLSQNLQEMRTAYLHIIGAIALVTIPAAVGLAAVAEPAIFVLVGPKWLDAVPVVEALALYGGLLAVDSNSYSAYMALGKPYLSTLSSATRAVILVPGLIIAVPMWGIEGAAWAMVAVAILLTPMNFAFLMRLMQLRIRDLVDVLWRPLVSAAIMYAVVYSLRVRIESGTPWREALVGLLMAVGLGGIVYIASCLALWYADGRRGYVERIILERLRVRWIPGS
jgi:lipopolysaccharide exporter